MLLKDIKHLLLIVLLRLRVDSFVEFYLWILPNQTYMLSDLHNMNCRKKKLFNYQHIIPTLEDKMLNRIRIKFHSSRYLFGVDIANMFQLFCKKLVDASNLIPFNSDYYYWVIIIFLLI